MNMFNISLDDVVRSYETVSKIAFRKYAKKDIDSCIDCVDVLAKIASNFNWMFTDQKIENLLNDISKEFVCKKMYASASQVNRIVFYDQIGSTTCLGLQYLRGLMNANYEIFYIFESSSRKCSPAIIKELNAYSNIKLLIVDHSESNKIDLINELYLKILDFAPRKAIFHSPAEGALGIILWNALPQIERYRIVPGDHHFYFGVSCSDYYFEFRKYGYTIATQKRNISPDKIFLQPYYPIINNKIFAGFPSAQTENKVIVFSAGAMYKTYGESDLFFNILKRILSDHPQVVILFAGGGFDAPFKKFIEKNNLQERLILLGYRTDLEMCIANADIYLATYPFTGGLTTQYAAYYGKPILSYTDKNLSCNFIEDIIGVYERSETTLITRTDLDVFFDYANRLVIDESFRKDEGKRVKTALTTQKRFDDHLNQILKEKSQESIESIFVNNEKSVELYLNVENRYIPTLKSFLLNTFRWKFLFLFPQLILPTLFSKALYQKILTRK